MATDHHGPRCCKAGLENFVIEKGGGGGRREGGGLRRGPGGGGGSGGGETSQGGEGVGEKVTQVWMGGVGGFGWGGRKGPMAMIGALIVVMTLHGNEV